MAGRHNIPETQGSLFAAGVRHSCLWPKDGGVGSASLGSNAPELISVELDLREERSVRIRQTRPQACSLCETYALHLYLDLKVLIYGH